MPGWYAIKAKYIIHPLIIVQCVYRVFIIFVLLGYILIFLTENLHDNLVLDVLGIKRTRAWSY